MPLALIDSASHIVLVAHEHPDADSLGSASAFYSYLLRLQKKTTLYCSTEIGDNNLSFLPWCEKIKHTFPLDADLVISFDCGDYKRLGIEYSGHIINFDHHISNELYGTSNCIDPTALSTTQVLYNWFVANGIKINGKMANALYAGLMDDTNAFSARECTSTTFQIAQQLIQLGANHEQCVNALFNSHSLASMRLKGIMLSEMRLMHEGRTVVFEVNQELLGFTGAYLRDCKKTLDEALSLKTVKIAVLVAQLKRGGVKVSLRSDGILDVSEILSLHGGGGHRIRAGARLADMGIRETLEEILPKIKMRLDANDLLER